MRWRMSWQPHKIRERCEAMFGPAPGSSARWMLPTKSDSICRRPEIADLLSKSDRADSGKRLAWTEDQFTILPILRVRELNCPQVIPEEVEDPDAS